MSLLNRESKLRTIGDVKLLRGDEIEEFEELNKARFASKDRTLLVLACVAYPVLVIAFALLSVRFRDDPQDLGSLFDLLCVAVMFVGWFPIMGIWTDASDRAAREREERLTAFVRRIPGYNDRELRRHYGSGGSPAPSSRRQMQHEWYEGHSELDYTDRTRGEMYGMDADTYISNVAEHDRD